MNFNYFFFLYAAFPSPQDGAVSPHLNNAWNGTAALAYLGVPVPGPTAEADWLYMDAAGYRFMPRKVVEAMCPSLVINAGVPAAPALKTFEKLATSSRDGSRVLVNGFSIPATALKNAKACPWLTQTRHGTLAAAGREIVLLRAMAPAPAQVAP